MQPRAQEISTCPVCGSALEETPGGRLGCIVCSLRLGIWGEADMPQDIGSNERFGSYEIQHHPDGSLYELGRGAMGVTYRALDTSLQREVALKIIKIDVARRNAEARERFMREARAAAALRHPNVATVYQFGIREESGQFFYAMELIEGETLEERVRRTGPLDVGATIHIARQITAALAAAEKRGLIHRDLKPANLMLVSQNGETTKDDSNAFGEGAKSSTRGRVRSPERNEKLVVKIIDFGLAKALNAPVDPMRLTHDGFVGTPAFASPEQFDNATLDVRSDIYSLGATLWFALTGKTPFAGHSVEEIHHAQQSNALPIEQLKAAHVPSRLRSLLESMLAFEPAARPGTRDLAARLRRCAVQAGGTPRIRVAFAAAVILMLGVSAFLVVFPSLRTHPLAAGSASNLAAGEKSIAVLPFSNLSKEEQNAFFADGVQDEILTDLARVADLKVISRSSVMQYKSGVARNLRKVGQQLGVAHVVEGSVQRSGNRVRVNAQLVDARTDRHLWAQTYDRDLADVFAIQSEIAEQIVFQLKSKLSPEEKAAIEVKPTSDLTAHDLYIRAKTIIATGAAVTREYERLSEAISLLNQAIERDPAFALAYYQLAHAHDFIYLGGSDHTPARLAMAEAAIQSLSRLRPNSSEAHLAIAKHLYRCYRDYDHAREELKLAQISLPNDPEPFEILGYIDRRQGRWAESTKNLERAIELDPQNGFILGQIAFNYDFLRRYADEERILDRAITLAPKESNLRAFRAAIELYWHADPRPVISTIEAILAQDPREAVSIAPVWLEVSLCERDFDGASRALASLPSDGCHDGTFPFPRAWCEGIVARARGDKAAARAAFTNARTEVVKLVAEQPDYAEALCVLGMADAALGNKEDAIREGRRAVELLPVTKDAVFGPGVLQFLAIIYAWTGEKDLALEQLGIVAGIPGPLNYGNLRLDHYWDPLRGDPRFDKIVASLAPK
jgi:serine/threonine protein kinase/tetratricopeptide (TPR) repeat protein